MTHKQHADQTAGEAQREYEQLIEDVRMRQHALENQLSAAIGMDAEASERYLRELDHDQRYSHLLLCGEPLLAGLVYHKWKQAEALGISFECHVSTRMQKAAAAPKDMTAMLGILLDNAIEAACSMPDKDRRIEIDFYHEDGRDCVLVSNTHPYVPYNDIAAWFASGKSSKGDGRGLGLAHVRKLCEGGAADIIYGNRETNAENELFFILRFAPGEMPKDANTPDDTNASPGGDNAASDKRGRLHLRMKKAGGFLLIAALLLFTAAALLLVRRTIKAEEAEEEAIAPPEVAAETPDAEDPAKAAKESTVPLPATEDSAELAAAALAAFDSVDIPDELLPYHLYADDERSPADGPHITFPENTLWETGLLREDWVRPRQLIYDFYDDGGRHVERDVYVAGGMDSLSDKGIMHRLGEEIDPPSWTYSRRERECWEYDGDGRELRYLHLAQYGKELAPTVLYLRTSSYDADTSLQTIVECADDTPSLLFRTLDATGSCLREIKTDERGNILWQCDLSYDEDGYPLRTADMTLKWDEDHRSARVSETDIDGTEHEKILIYDEDGSLSQARYVQDGSVYLGCLIEKNEKGQIIEEIDDMPLLLTEPLGEEYTQLFYDEARTLQRRPRSHSGSFIYHAYSDAGTEAYRLAVDTIDGYGDLYLYEYDEAGRIAITYDWRILGTALDGFRLNTADGAVLCLSCGYSEYMLYEKDGGQFEVRQEYLTEAAYETADGRRMRLYRFSDGRPQSFTSPDMELDWTKPVIQ